jgi:signal transduction histidine kinase
MRKRIALVMLAALAAGSTGVMAQTPSGDNPPDMSQRPPSFQDRIKDQLGAARRMKSLVESLLVLARADAGKLELRPEPFDLKDLADECLHLVSAEAQTRSITIDSQLASLQIRADRGKLSQVLINLLTNAIRYNRPAGSVNLKIAPDIQTNTVSIAVSDTGLGIAPEDQPHIFERFFRADKARSNELGGSGLGLAICQSIISAHGGTITLASKPGEGSAFTVHLPTAAG